MKWNDRVKEARVNAGISKSDFAKAVKVSAPTVTDWESGEIKKIDGENLLRAASVLGVTAEWIIFGTVIDNGEDVQAATVANAFKRIADPAQKEAILTQLKAFGVLGEP